MKTVAIIQARMGATRLPGKVMRVLGDRSVLAHVIQRVAACPILDAVVVATTTSTPDDVLAAEAMRYGASVCRGSEYDVLSRYYLAAMTERADIVVRITADCPFIDAVIIGEVLRSFKGAANSGRPFDYFSNTLERTYPRGLDVEVFSYDALQRAYREATFAHEREHVTPYLYGHPEKFRLGQLRGEPDLSDHRWTLDTEEDWQFIKAVYTELDRSGRQVTTANILELLQHRPDLVKINSHIEQKKVGS
ncbi:MAG TPA: glycosyltransferase family protein [Nevskiales bacterium]|nr:glycosyltransferase family protein [Nevskiales bacterium]